MQFDKELLLPVPVANRFLPLFNSQIAWSGSSIVPAVAFFKSISCEQEIISVNFTHNPLYKNEFGRPHYVNKNLIHQTLSDGATVNSLVTKSTYWGKPLLTANDGAFNQITRDFEVSGLKSLMCYSIGCVRDLVELDHSLKKNFKFPKPIGASILIVCSDLQSRGL